MIFERSYIGLDIPAMDNIHQHTIEREELFTKNMIP